MPVTDQDWTRDPFVLHRSDGRLYGRGTCDMKGFLAAAVVMARYFAATPMSRPVHFAVTYDEEVGCLGARNLIPDLETRGVRPAMTLVGEPTEMRVIEGHKGCCEYTTRFIGHEGHGSAPDLGVNAVEYAVRYVAHLLQLRADLVDRTPDGSRFEPPWTTINIGQISGGVAHNVIATTAEIAWDMRPVQSSDQTFVQEALARYVNDVLLPDMRHVWPEAAITMETIGEVVGLEPMSENAARDLVMRLVGANGADVVAFGTEAGLFRRLGSDVVVCGPGSITQAHKADEFVSVDQMRACLTMLERLPRSPVLTEGTPPAAPALGPGRPTA